MSLEVFRIPPVPNIRRELMWTELLVADGALARLIDARKHEPSLAQYQLDVRLLCNLKTGSVNIQDEAVPDYPWIFEPTTKCSFLGIGTNNVNVALSMVLWSAAADTMSQANKASTPGNKEYRRSIVKSFQLAMLAGDTYSLTVAPEYQPPMVSMQIQTLLSLLLECMFYCTSKKSAPDPTTLRGAQANIGAYIRDIENNAVLDRAWTKWLKSARTWHHQESAVLEAEHALELCSTTDDNKRLSELYKEIEHLLQKVSRTSHPAYTEASKELEITARKHDSPDYRVHLWDDMEHGRLDTPELDTMASKIRDTGTMDFAYEMFPDLNPGTTPLSSAAAGSTEEMTVTTGGASGSAVECFL